MSSKSVRMTEFTSFASSANRKTFCKATNKAYQNAFALFDKRGTGKVSIQALGDLLRACGQNPTLAEIDELEESVGGDCKFLWST